MFSTLRRRFIFSHLVPLLIIVPLIGIALIYLLEAQVVLPSLSNELVGQAGLVVEMARDQPGVWTDPAQAQAFVARVSPRLTARLMLLDGGGRLLVSSDPNDAVRLGLPLDHPGLEQALSGQVFSQQARSQGLRAEVADVLTPALGADQQVAGVVRLSYPLTSVYERFQLLRYLIAGVLVVGLILGAIAGTVLALDLGRPIQETHARCGATGLRAIARPVARAGTGGNPLAGPLFQCPGGAVAHARRVAAPAVGKPGARVGAAPRRIAGRRAGPRRGCGPGSGLARRITWRDGSANPSPAAPAGRPGTAP